MRTTSKPHTGYLDDYNTYLLCNSKSNTVIESKFIMKRRKYVHKTLKFYFSQAPE